MAIIGTQYRLDVYTPSRGEQVASWTDFLELSYGKRIDSPGMLTFARSTQRPDGEQDPIMGEITDGWIIDVWRQSENVDWYRDFTGVVRSKISRIYGGAPYSVISCPGIMSFLSRRIVAWYANHENRSFFVNKTAGEIIANLCVYNFGGSASVANGRLLEGWLPNDIAYTFTGNSIIFYCAYQNLLEACQDVAAIGGGDFTVDMDHLGRIVVRWYVPYHGDDRSEDVIFSLERGNMENPEYCENWMDEKTAVVVGGQGQDSERQIAIVEGPNYIVSYKDQELFVNATSVEEADYAGLVDQGRVAAIDNRFTPEFTFGLIQAPNARYGEDYYIGDLVTVLNPFTGEEYYNQIYSAQISFSKDVDEDIVVEVNIPKHLADTYGKKK